jgi:YVTN family beta-propeller protein
MFKTLRLLNFFRQMSFLCYYLYFQQGFVFLRALTKNNINMIRLGDKIVLFAVLALVATACLQNPFEGEEPVVVQFPFGQSAFVLNEGEAGQGNASIDHLNLLTGEYRRNIFQTANNQPLGDGLKDMAIVQGRAYLVLSNSSKIEVVEMDSFNTVGTITGLEAPRFIQFVSSNKAYVSDQSADELAVIDPVSLEKTGSVPLPGWTEDMTFKGNRLYVTNKTSDKVYLVNVENDVVADSIQLSYGPSAIEQDINGLIWVYCSGDEQQGIDAALYSIEPITQTVVDTFTFPVATVYEPRMAYNPVGNALYLLLGEGVRALSLITKEFAPDPLVPADGFSLYGVDIDPQVGNVFVLDARDYRQQGEVEIYLPTGEPIRTFPAGVVPNAVEFY